MWNRRLHSWIVPLLMISAALMAPEASGADHEAPPGTPAASEAGPAEPEQPRERRWRLRFFGSIAGGDGVPAVAVGDWHSGVAFSGGGGVGVNFEYRTSPKMGFEIGAMAVGGQVRVGAAKKAGRHVAAVAVDGYVPVTFAFNYHPITEPGAVDVYVGPLAASTFISGVAVGPGVRVGSRVDFGIGANAGVDIGFGARSRWSFGTGLKYIRQVSDSGGDDYKSTFDPLIFSFGFGFKF